MTLLFDVWLVVHAMQTFVDDALVESGLSGDDYALYSLLRRFGPATPTRISRWTGMRPTTVSVALKRLAERGHAERSPNPADGRSYLVGLSEAGVAAHDAASPGFLAAVRALAGEVGTDLRRERAVLQDLDAGFRAVLGLDARPYDLSSELPAGTSELTDAGAQLTPEQEHDVRRYVDFVRSRTG